jgi:Short C-terminal domain/Phospholipase_D-nuclease N-terminal
MFIADYSFGDVLLSILAFYLVVMLIWVLFAIIGDVFRDSELSGGGKALWLVALLFVPWISAFVYLIARGDGMRERKMRDVAEAQQAQESYIRDVAGSSPVDELAKLNALRREGAISQAEFDSLKAKLVPTSDAAPPATA